jgi:hypothetical protein
METYHIIKLENDTKTYQDEKGDIKNEQKRCYEKCLENRS